MNQDPIRLAAIEEAKLKHADAVMQEPAAGRYKKKGQKRTQNENTVNNVLTLRDIGLKRNFVVSVAVTSVDPDWKPQHPTDVPPDNGMDDQLLKYQKVITKFLNEIHEHIE